MKIFTFFAILWFFSTAYSQCSPEALRKYDLVNDDVQMAKEFAKNNDFENELKYAKMAVSKSKKIERKHNCYWNVPDLTLADSYLHQNMPEEALEIANEAYNFCTQFDIRNLCECKWSSQMKMGAAYSAMGNDSLAIQKYKEALSECENSYGVDLIRAYIIQSIGSLEIKNREFKSGENKVNEAKKIVEDLGITIPFSFLILGKCNLSLGIVNFEESHCDDALALLSAGLDYAEGEFDYKTVATTNFYIGKIYEQKSNLSGATRYYQRSLDLAQQMKDTSLIINSSNSLGNIYAIQGKNEGAIEKTKYAFELATKTKFKHGLIDSYNIDAHYDFNCLPFEESVGQNKLAQAQMALTMASDLEYSRGMVEAYQNIMEYYFNSKHEFHLAEKYAEKAKNLSDSVGYIKGLVDAYIDMGELHARNNTHLDSTLYFFNLAIKTAKTGNYNHCGTYNVGIIISYIRIGQILSLRHKDDEATINFRHALELAKEIDYMKGIDLATKEIEKLSGQIRTPNDH